MSERPDSRVFASYPMPPKIDLLNERPRRESQVERQLENQIGQISSSASVPKIMVTEQRSVTTSTDRNIYGHQQHQQQRQQQQQQQQQHQPAWAGQGGRRIVQTSEEQRGPNDCEIRETRIIINQHSSPVKMSNNLGLIEHQRLADESSQEATTTLHTLTQHTSNTQQSNNYTNSQGQQQVPSPNVALNQTISNNKAVLAAELADKEEKLLREVSALHQRPYSPYQTPAKIDLTSEQWASQQQHRNAPASRPNSRTSNKSNPAQDLLEKEAKLLKEIEEIESKPYNPQTMIVEREQWYEYPEGTPLDRHLTDSKRRVRDFCSMPPGLCQDRHIHEENLLPRPGQVAITPESIHTTIIRSPKQEVDNKSPLPFAFDNFTTKGVRGNIASVGAVEPDRPRPPIFPIVKRSPSPNVARG